MPSPSTLQPVKKVGLWKPPARAIASARCISPAAAAAQTDAPASLSARLLPEHFADPELPAFFARARGRVLAAEGDSWFDYPAPFRIDLLDELDNLGREVVSLAFRGDTLENMVYGTEGTAGDLVEPDLVRLAQMVEEMRPKAVLFSAGGNDVAGAEFASFLNHVQSGREPLRLEYLRFIVREYARDAFLRAANAVWDANPIAKFITHGYANAIPTGIGVGNLFGQLNFIGPWLKPACDAKGYGLTNGAGIVRAVLAEFNEMLRQLAAEDSRFVYVDFRPHVGNDPEDWANELHLTNAGIRTAARVFNDAITAAIGE